MVFKEQEHVYLAAPFFNDKQRELCDFIEAHNAVIYSPRKDGGVLKPDSSNEERKEIFESNTNAIDSAAWVLAVIDDFDAGVLWEMGYAWGVKKDTLGYSDVEGRGLNVMLAGSCNLGFINGRQQLSAILNKRTYFPYNTWRGEIQ